MEQTKRLMEIISEEICQYEDFVSNKLKNLFLELDINLVEHTQEEKDWLEVQIKNLIEPDFFYKRIFLNSILIQFFGKPEYVEEISNLVSNNSKVRPITKYYLACNLSAAMFLNKNLETSTTKYLVWKLFQEACDTYEDYLNLDLLEIPKELRNSNLVLVFTDQFVKISHGPTKTALDRCAMIKQQLKKECLLINTAEGFSHEGEIPFLLRSIPGHHIEGSYIPEYCEREYQEWKGIKIPFVQCEANMPNPIGVEMLLNTVKQLKPQFIVDIGGTSLVANLCKKLVPVIGLSLCPSDLVFTTETYQAIGRKIEKEDLDLLQKVNLPDTHVIESVFTSSFAPQKQHLERSQMSFGENEFIIAVVGFRLNAEVTPDFIKMLESVLSENIKVAFIGGFEDYEKLVENYSILNKYSYFLGFQEDVLSIVENCDLYVNPIRKGGGTSCVEALSKGIPVVATCYGDVATNVGEVFCVNDYEEMKDQIIKYYEEPEYYDKMSKKALERAGILQDTNHAFYNILDEMCKREGFVL